MKCARSRYIEISHEKCSKARALHGFFYVSHFNMFYFCLGCRDKFICLLARADERSAVQADFKYKRIDNEYTIIKK